jgi:large repetitive protein
VFRIKATPWYSVLLSLAVACSSSEPSAPTAPPPPSGQQPNAPEDAVAQGVTVLSKDANGAPRLLRTIKVRPAKAGVTAAQAARDHVAALAPLYVKKSASTQLADKASQVLRNGGALVTLKQQIDGIDVHNGDLRVMVHPDGSLGAISGTLAPAGGKPTFTSTAAVAVERALDKLFGANRAKVGVVEGAEVNGWQSFSVASAAEYRVDTVRVKRELQRVGARGYVPSWLVEVSGYTAASTLYAAEDEFTAHRYLISDRDGSISIDANLVHSDSFLYRVFSDTTGNRRPTDGALQDYSPHPTGTPDNTVPGLATQSLVAMEAFNGPHDAWLPNDATGTIGNNADAFSDRAAPEGFGPGDVRPAVTTGRVLNYAYNPALEPLATDTQSAAAAVNSFFVVNWLHDWYYDSGFTEATGNAQQSNYGRGGLENDRIVVHAQSNAINGSRNNANMFTPSDGSAPHMRMFLFGSSSDARLITPTGTLNASYTHTGPRSFTVPGNLVAVNDGVSNTGDGCQPITSDLAGKIALLDWTQLCSPSVFLRNAQTAGAIGAVIIFPLLDTAPFPFVGNPTGTLPNIVVSNADGQALKAAVATAPLAVTVRRRVTRTESNGDFDNGIVAHEWGHYLHHRLAVCEATLQCAAMSEGWGDFNALLLALRDGDNRTGSYGMGVSALAGGGFEPFGHRDPGYFGIRRYPYSLSKTKNPLSYRHIGDDNALPSDVPVNESVVENGNSQVHNSGEVWATQLWESYNALVDAHGVNTARRRMTDYVVLGLLLTPPEASFLEGRDGLLTAAALLDTDDMLLLAAGFANRGSGSCALPPTDLADNSGIVESSNIAGQLAVGAASLSDDGASCDQDGHLDAGESGFIRFTIANGGVLDAESVVATASSTTPGLEFGEPVVLDTIGRFSAVEIAIPVSLAADAPTNVAASIDVTVTSEFTCERSLSLSLSHTIGVDEAENVAKTDHFDTQVSAWTTTGDTDGVWGLASLDGNQLLFGADAPFTSDTQAQSPALQVSATEPFTIGFNHSYDLEAFDPFEFYDGGVIELSNDGGTSWADVTTYNVDPQYPATISIDYDNPLAGRPAFSATSANFPTLAALGTLDFGTQFAGQSLNLRFRIGTDFCCNQLGWLIDDVAVGGIDNLPFTGVVPETTTCDADEADLSGGETARHRAPARSLRALDLTISE